LGRERNDTESWRELLRRSLLLSFSRALCCQSLHQGGSVGLCRWRYHRPDCRSCYNSSRRSRSKSRHVFEFQNSQGRGSVISKMKPSPTGEWREIAKLGLELLVASYGSTAGAAMLMPLLYPLAQAIDSGLSFHQFNRIFSVPYFPVQIAFGFAVGYLGRNRFGTRFSVWVWTFPLLVFIWHFAAFEPSVFQGFWRVRLDHFVGSGCRPPECFDQLSYTSPVYTSIAYVLGSSVRGKRQRASRFPDPGLGV
jgi:hypothetical protein